MSSKKVNIFNYILSENGTITEGKKTSFAASRLPVQKEKSSTDWVIFGEDPDWKNQQPQYYDYLSKMSSKNGGILKQKNRYTWGKGWGFNILGLDRPAEIALKGFMNSIGKTRLWKRIISDRNKYGGFAVEMIPTEDKKNVAPHYIHFKNIRVGKDEYTQSKGKGEEPELLPTKYYFTKDWSLSKGKIMAAPDYEVFEEWSWDFEPSDIDKDKRYLLYYKDEGFEDEAYPLPDYQGGIPYIIADAEVGNFVKKNVEQGFTAGLLVQFFGGEPTPEQQSELQEMWDGFLHGSENAGKALLAWADAQDEEIKITPIGPNGQDSRYKELNDQICQETFIAHTTPPEIVGLTGDNGFSNDADAKRTAEESFNNNFVQSAQEPIEIFANILLEYNEIRGEVFLINLDPVRAQFSEQTLLSIATNQELRDLAGLPVIEQESNPVADALATISPLVANKILENMSREEIRNLVGLKTTEPLNKVTHEIIAEFSKEDQDELIFKYFEKTGIPDEELTVIAELEFCAENIEDAKRITAEFKSQQFKKHGFLTVTENTVLQLLISNPDLSVEELAELTKLSEAEIEEILQKLQEEDKLDENLDPIAEPEEEVFTVYKYEKRSDVSGPAVIEGTRAFCRNLVNLSKFQSWTIDEIERMNNGMGLDVFTSRGGWRTLPDITPARRVPFCRHIWKALLVRRVTN